MSRDEMEIERLAETRTPRGELVLRRRGEVLELISNGTFLMDTSNGDSERALARCGVAGLPGGARVLIGGLGFGFTLAEVLAHDVAEAIVVELEPHVVMWNRTWWPPARSALDDPRTSVVIDDVQNYIATTTSTFDAMLLDIDNGPDWTVTDDNSALYGDAALDRLRRLINMPGGRLCVWSADDSAAFAARLQRHFADVTTVDVPVARGNPDVIFVATQ